MKKIVYILIFIITALPFITLQARSVPERDTLSMGAGYANDLFYSFQNGEVAAVERDNWEIAFYTSAFSTGIITNGGSGVRLYTWPEGDTSDWVDVTASGIATWDSLSNSPHNWEEGAFNRNATGHPDYGWGIYDMGSHHIVGDSIYVIDLPLSGLKKLWIIEKDPLQNIYQFRYANLDGTDEHEVEFDISTYTDKRFAYYSLTNNEMLDREPDSERWDIVFTKYVDLVPDLQGNLSSYIVTGVLSNVDIASNQFYPVAPDFMDWNDKPMDSVINNIGYDWKELDFGTFTWEILDSNYYFIRNYDGNIYKLGFVWWDGSSTGDFALDKEFVTTVQVDELKDQQPSFRLFPNPADNYLTIQTPTGLEDHVVIYITDQTGRQVYSLTVTADELNNSITIQIPELSPGFYLVSLSGKNYTNSQKLIVR